MLGKTAARQGRLKGISSDEARLGLLQHTSAWHATTFRRQLHPEFKIMVVSASDGNKVQNIARSPSSQVYEACPSQNLPARLG